MTTASPEALPTWDLSDLYAGIDDPNIQSDMDDVLARARDFEMRYKETIAVDGLSASHLATALADYLQALERRVLTDHADRVTEDDRRLVER